MGNARNGQATSDYGGREDLDRAMLEALVASGKDVDALTVEDLAPLDQFHGGAKPATDRLARLAALTPGTRVLDVGGGVGGPARTLAVQFGCHVTVIDLTESYVRAGEMLTARMGLGDRVTHRIGDALDLPFGDGTFDVVWMQNSGMNIAEKGRLYAGLHRVLRPGGRLVVQEPMAGPVQPIIFPVMWARDPSSSFLMTPAEARATIEGAGFRVRAWDDVTAEFPRPAPGTPEPPYTFAQLVMGDALPAIMDNPRRNEEERRMVTRPSSSGRRLVPEKLEPGGVGSMARYGILGPRLACPSRQR